MSTSRRGKRGGRPKHWYFPSPNKGKVIVCDYNPDDKVYNRNCREIDRKNDLPRELGAAVARVMNAIEKYGDLPAAK
ncbi:hypothetical protein GOA69_33160 [Sinorhizobium meliloti]|nr:hypothetical protein [Sinorhizobium meliloti]